MIIRREVPEDIEAIRAVTADAFRSVEHRAPSRGPDGDPGEAWLVDALRADDAWMPRLSFVAVEDGAVVGHVVATRAQVGGRAVLGLGPVSVAPSHQRDGVGRVLMHAVLGAADALDEPLVGLLGDPAYYSRFGFVPSLDVGVVPPDPAWGHYFQVRLLTSYDGQAGLFRYAGPFDEL